MKRSNVAIAIRSVVKLGILAPIVLLLVVLTFSGSSAQAATARHVHRVQFPFTYTRVGTGRSYWFHVAAAQWSVEERNRRP
jgi:hypothetical protein